MRALETRKASRSIQDSCQVVKRDLAAGPPMFLAPHHSQVLDYMLGIQAGMNLIYQNPAWDFRTYNVDRDVKVADDSVGRQLNAVDPGLRAFEKTGGKLIMFHGWSDSLLSPMSTVEYYHGVITKMGRKDTQRFSRL